MSQGICLVSQGGDTLRQIRVINVPGCLTLRIVNRFSLEVNMNYQNLFNLVFAIALICLPASSLSQPSIVVDPQEVNIAVGLNEQMELALSVSNDGEETLVWRGELEIIREPERRIPERDQPGDLIAIFDGINAPNEYCSPVAWDYDHARMWVTNYNQGLAVAYHPTAGYQDFEAELQINLQTPMDGAYANGVLFLPSYNTTTIQRYDAEGRALGRIQMPYQIKGLAADPVNQWLFVLNGATNAIHVYPLEGNQIGGELGRITNHMQFHNNAVAEGLEWVTDHHEGQLWMVAPNTGRAHQIMVDTDNWRCTESVQDFLVFPNRPEQPPSSLAHDGAYLWAAGYVARNIRVYDDGIEEAPYIHFDPANGEIEPGSGMDVILSFQGSEANAGFYEAILYFISNDPENPEVDVNISVWFAVGEGAPELSFQWPDEAGYPDRIDFNAFHDWGVFAGYPYSVPITFRNQNAGILSILNFTTDHPDFRADPNGLFLGEEEEGVVDLIVQARQAGMILDTLRFETNDDRHQIVSIPLRVQALDAPIIEVESGDLDLEFEGVEATSSITIVNDGSTVLRWRTDVLAGQGRDDGDETSLRVEPSEGTTEPGEFSDLSLLFNLIGGDGLEDQIDLVITSNDPVRPTVTLGYTLHWLGIGSQDNRLPSTTELISTYPNPFNNSTTISFAVGAHRDAPLRLGIYGLDGRLVADLLTGRNAYPPGNHSIVWNADGIPAGSYFVRLEAGSGVVQEKWLRLVK